MNGSLLHRSISELNRGIMAPIPLSEGCTTKVSEGAVDGLPVGAGGAQPCVPCVLPAASADDLQSGEVEDTTAAVLSLTYVRRSVGFAALEREVACVLFGDSAAANRVSVMIDDNIDEHFSECTVVVCSAADSESCSHQSPEALAQALDQFIASQRGVTNSINSMNEGCTGCTPTATETCIRTSARSLWLDADRATCVVGEEEQEVIVDEEEALKLWREQVDVARTGHLEAVPNPDGFFVQPMHALVPANSVGEEGTSTNETSNDDNFSKVEIERQLRRDPFLFELDNIERVNVADLARVSWTEPVMITGAHGSADGYPRGSASGNEGDRREGPLSRETLASLFGDAEVRTGNRETLIDNGFVNSKPMRLRDALESSTSTCFTTTIVFSPVCELPSAFQAHLAPLTASFPSEHEAQGGARVDKRFTLCLAPGAGFGIGFHRHNAALFLLLEGEKKWYIGPQSTENDTPTHPGFYTTKSTHKCIQTAGEILYVPDQWYHEIFNLGYTAGIQALPA